MLYEYIYWHFGHYPSSCILFENVYHSSWTAKDPHKISWFLRGDFKLLELTVIIIIITIVISRTALLSHSLAKKILPDASGFYFFGFRKSNFFYRARFSALRQTPYLEDQVPLFMSPSDRVAQLYPKTLGVSPSTTRRATVEVFSNLTPYGEELTVIGVRCDLRLLFHVPEFHDFHLLLSVSCSYWRHFICATVVHGNLLNHSLVVSITLQIDVFPMLFSVSYVSVFHMFAWHCVVFTYLWCNLAWYFLFPSRGCWNLMWPE
jgi:hypothetical protein